MIGLHCLFVKYILPLESLVKAPASEDWLATLHRDAPGNRELYRDPMHGFVLLAHTEYEGLYRPPHDHGRGWVIYAIQQGEIEMGTYGRIDDPDGSVRLVKRGSTLIRPGGFRSISQETSMTQDACAVLRFCSASRKGI